MKLRTTRSTLFLLVPVPLCFGWYVLNAPAEAVAAAPPSRAAAVFETAAPQPTMHEALLTCSHQVCDADAAPTEAPPTF